MTKTKFTLLPLRLRRLIVKGLPNQYTAAKSLGFALPEEDQQAFKVWDLFFQRHVWLEKAVAAGCTPYLVGHGLHRLIRGDVAPWESMHLALVCKGFTQYSELVKDLRPNKLHEHGRVLFHDLAFEAHNITLNVECIYGGNGSFANGIYTRWPSRLSIATKDDRISAYLGYGQSIVQKVSVKGLGKDPRPEESTAQVCSLPVSDDQALSRVVFCRVARYLFAYSESIAGWEYSEDYEGFLKRYIDDRLACPRNLHCPACVMKGQFSYDFVQ